MQKKMLTIKLSAVYQEDSFLFFLHSFIHLLSINGAETYAGQYLENADQLRMSSPMSLTKAKQEEMDSKFF